MCPSNRPVDLNQAESQLVRSVYCTVPPTIGTVGSTPSSLDSPIPGSVETFRSRSVFRASNRSCCAFNSCNQGFNRLNSIFPFSIALYRLPNRCSTPPISFMMVSISSLYAPEAGPISSLTNSTSSVKFSGVRLCCLILDVTRRSNLALLILLNIVRSNKCSFIGKQNKLLLRG